MTPTSIETMTGKFVDLVNPDPGTIDIRDIAWATSRMPRYVGHTVSTIPYTIAQHSIFVTELVVELLKKDGCYDLRQSFYRFLDRKYLEQPAIYEACTTALDLPPTDVLLLELLMHDASEAYIVDVPTPLKQADGFREVYMRLEDRMMGTIREAMLMGDPDPVHQVFVKWADQAALTIEAHHLIRSRGANWTRLISLGMTSLGLFKEPKPPIEVYEEFLGWFEELTARP